MKHITLIAFILLFNGSKKIQRPRVPTQEDICQLSRPSNYTSTEPAFCSYFTVKAQNQLFPWKAHSLWSLVDVSLSFSKENGRISLQIEAFTSFPI
uniref:Uncharacterized protein MANES_03G018900 n=1 Tax=Rhizophora mucronata TaxID=61149 RepID=A0A2P2IVY1_RHIMU